jgi:hypothetical protein
MSPAAPRSCPRLVGAHCSRFRRLSSGAGCVSRPPDVPPSPQARGAEGRGAFHGRHAMGGREGGEGEGGWGGTGAVRRLMPAALQAVSHSTPRARASFTAILPGTLRARRATPPQPAPPIGARTRRSPAMALRLLRRGHGCEAQALARRAARRGRPRSRGGGGAAARAPPLGLGRGRPLSLGRGGAAARQRGSAEARLRQPIHNTHLSTILKVSCDWPARTRLPAPSTASERISRAPGGRLPAVQRLAGLDNVLRRRWRPGRASVVVAAAAAAAATATATATAHGHGRRRAAPRRAAPRCAAPPRARGGADARAASNAMLVLASPRRALLPWPRLLPARRSVLWRRWRLCSPALMTPSSARRPRRSAAFQTPPRRRCSACRRRACGESSAPSSPTQALLHVR